MESPGFFLTIFAFVAVIGPLVFVHEMGHYLVARWCGVHAETFSIGFGPELFGWNDRRGTRWRVAALPLGGYVKFLGDMDASSQSDPRWLEMPAEQRRRSFPAQTVGRRAAIVAAGPLVNLAFAVLLLGGLAWLNGESYSPPVIGKVEQGSAAQGAGLREGDHILSIMDRPVDSFRDITAIVTLRPAEPLDYVIEREGRRMEMTIRAGTLLEKDRFGNIYRIGRLGIASGALEKRDVAIWQAPLVGWERMWEVTGSAVDGLGQIITGRRPATELGGPLKIADVSGQAASMGWENFLVFMALISINLGFINLLPIPMLDGGHLLFYAIEAVQRRPVNAQLQEWAFRSGLFLLLTLMLFVTFNDLASFGLWKSLSGLIG